MDQGQDWPHNTISHMAIQENYFTLGEKLTNDKVFFFFFFLIARTKLIYILPTYIGSKCKFSAKLVSLVSTPILKLCKWLTALAYDQIAWERVTVVELRSQSFNGVGLTIEKK